MIGMCRGILDDGDFRPRNYYEKGRFLDIIGRYEIFSESGILVSGVRLSLVISFRHRTPETLVANVQSTTV